MSDTLTKKLRRAATLQHRNVTPKATPKTIPQSFWLPVPCCQLIATAVANSKTTDAALNITPRIAALLAVHSLTGIWYGRMVVRKQAITLDDPSPPLYADPDRGYKSG